MPIPVSKLKSQLLTSELQQKNPVLFQLINGIIDNLIAIQLATATGNGTNIINEFNTIQMLTELAGSDSGGDDGIGIPGPQGIQGLIGNTGPMGPMGAIIVPPDAEDGDIFPPIVGPQGNPGPTGSNGPVGPMFPAEDGLDGEDAIHIIEQITQSGGSSDLLVARKVISEAELEAANSSPIDIGISAPGADKIIYPLAAWFEVDLSVVYTSSPTWTIIYNGDTSNLMSVSMTPNLQSVTGKKSVSANGGAPGFTNYSGTFDPRNKIIRLRANANPSGAGTATGVVVVPYAILQTT